MSLFLEIYRGSYIDDEGKRKHIREYEYLKKYVYENPENAKERKENREALEFANNVLAIKRAEIASGKYGLHNPYKNKGSFLSYFEEKMEEKVDSPKNYANWSATLVHLRRFVSPDLTFEGLDEKFMKRIRKYFDKEAVTKSNTKLSENSKYSYFNKVKACIRSAYEDGLIPVNYAVKVKSFEQSESQREYLTHEELQKMINVDCKYPVLKRAFIFSCLTGLRWSDVNTLTWSEVRDEINDGEEFFKINFRQEKTEALEYLYISKIARSILGNRKSKADRVFIGLKYSAVYNAELVRWTQRAGINKHITFHSARHTNAVLLLENGADIYTVSKRLGHSELRTTQIYAKMVDKKNKEAAELIPQVFLKEDMFAI